MYREVRQRIKRLDTDAYQSLHGLYHTAKNLFNQATYNNRQGIINDDKFPTYEENYAALKSSENYKILNSNMAQQILKEVDANFKSFADLTEAVKEGNYPSEKVRLPRYYQKMGLLP